MKNKNNNSYRLTEEYIFEYLRDEYKGEAQSEKCKVINLTPLVQKDYGLALDCTLTSITTIIYYLVKEKEITHEIYEVVEKIAKKYFYNGEKLGTIPIFIKKIFDESLRKFLPNKRINSKQFIFKQIGYNWNKLCKEIDNNNPVILSIWNDGRNYYKNHTVTVIGYRIFKVNNKKIKTLIIYDNWSKAKSYLDFKKLYGISSVNYF